jgi:fructose-1,6-bisphosphatase/inositol monophosphatase family enzyme
MTVDPERVAAALTKVAAQVILPRFGALGAHEVRQKSGPSDLVTEVDESAETALREVLGEIAPDAAFVGEEGVAKDGSLEGVLGQKGAVWVVDPLDGTRNFVAGIREFGTIVALVVDGRTMGGWICAIPDGYCAWAVRGEGAFIDGVAITPHPPKERLAALRSLGWLDPREADRLRNRLKRHFADQPSHCSAYAYLKLAHGAVDLKISSRIHAWDHLAGALILDELGGRTAFLDGAPYRAGPSADRALLATAPGRDWNAIAARLNDVD